MREINKQKIRKATKILSYHFHKFHWRFLEFEFEEVDSARIRYKVESPSLVT